jgi:23S rRNA (guanosine2251-2'-O)-methyltransferase
MVERSKRKKAKRKKLALLGSHARSWVWGRNVVREALTAGRWRILELFLADNLPAGELEEARSAAERAGLTPQIVGPGVLEQQAHTAEHQGYLAKMGPYPYRTVDEVLSAAPAEPLFLVLDAIQDPYNFGAMLRSAGAFGINGVFIGTHRQVPVTSMVARSSAGVVNHVPIVQVASLNDLVRTLRERGIRLIGATEKADVPLTECDLRGATAIVVGNEGTGISPELLACCDFKVRIPIEPVAGSLNAAAAAAVFFFEARRQRAAGGQSDSAALLAGSS